MGPEPPASKPLRAAGAGARAALAKAGCEVIACAVWLLPATCLFATAARAGDATHFLICRSEGCVDIPSLRFFPKGQAPTGQAPTAAAAPPPAGAAAPAPAPNQAQPDALQREIEADIVAFCEQHPDERFCGKLRLWFQRHPEARGAM
jgi:hypothetical protein